jgi:enterochelin esterase-like enzyme
MTSPRAEATTPRFETLEAFLAAASKEEASRREAVATLRRQLSAPGAAPWVQPDGEFVAFIHFDEPDRPFPETRGEPEAYVSTNYHDWAKRGPENVRLNLRMTRVPETPVLFAKLRFPRDARVHYTFLLAHRVEPAASPSERSGFLANVRIFDREIVDPLNAERAFSGFGEHSVLRMPGFAPSGDLAARASQPPPPAERFRKLKWRSDALGNEREVQLYLPPGWNEAGGKRFPLLLVHDGHDHAREPNALPRTLDLLIGRGEMAPVAAAFVPPVEREKEYRLSAEFPRAIIDELLPLLRREAPLSDDPGAHASLGCSYGALISSHLCLERPDLFGRGVFHAGAYAGTAYREVADRVLSGAKKLPGRYFLGCGSFDYLYPQFLIMRAATRAAGVDVLCRETSEGHEWDAWVEADFAALRHVFPPNEPA